MKVIEIQYCGEECPYFSYVMAEMFTRGGNYCNNVDSYIPEYYKDGFPLHCPLKDAI
jgi:hypothetical protein